VVLGGNHVIQDFFFELAEVEFELVNRSNSLFYFLFQNEAEFSGLLLDLEVFALTGFIKRRDLVLQQNFYFCQLLLAFVGDQRHPF